MPEVRDLAELLELCRRPLDPAAPWGVDPNHESDYLDLRVEFDQIAGVDWVRVKELATEVLSRHSKDLNTLTYLTLALLEVDGYAGLCGGLEILHGWLDDDEAWKNIFPKRERARGNALGLLAGRLETRLSLVEPEETDRAELAAVEKLLGELQESARDRLMHRAPGFGQALQQVREWAAKMPAADEEAAAGDADSEGERDEGAGDADGEAEEVASREPEEPGEAAAEVAPQRAPAKPAADLDLPEDAPLEEGADAPAVRRRMLVLVPFLRRAEPSSPTPYRLSRLVKWGDVAVLPEHDAASGKTALAPPRPEKVKALATRAAKELWAELVDEADNEFLQKHGTFWLDLQRYVSRGLQETGGSRGRRAAAAVRDEVASLVDRLPGVVELRYSNGLPFADDETRAWIDSAVRPVELPRSTGDGDGAASRLDEEQVQEVERLLAEDEVAAATEILQQAVESTTAPRSVFRTRLHAARLLLRAGRLEAVVSLLGAMRSELEELSAARWEPAAAVELYELLGLCHQRRLARAEGVARERVERELDEVRATIGALDLRALARLDEVASG